MYKIVLYIIIVCQCLAMGFMYFMKTIYIYNDGSGKRLDWTMYKFREFQDA